MPSGLRVAAFGVNARKFRQASPGSEEAHDKFTTCPMKNGNRSTVEKIAMQCVAPIKVREEKESLTVFANIVRRVKPPMAQQKGRVAAPIPSERGRKRAIQ
jgi:ribosomal protein S7